LKTITKEEVFIGDVKIESRVIVKDPIDCKGSYAEKCLKYF